MSFEVANGSGEDKEIAFCKQTMFQIMLVYLVLRVLNVKRVELSIVFFFPFFEKNIFIRRFSVILCNILLLIMTLIRI